MLEREPGSSAEPAIQDQPDVREALVLYEDALWAGKGQRTIRLRLEDVTPGRQLEAEAPSGIGRSSRPRTPVPQGFHDGHIGLRAAGGSSHRPRACG